MAYLNLLPVLTGKINNKFYALQNRRRKKAYVKELEEKVSELESKVLYLNNELSVYKNKMFSIASGGDTHFTDFENYREMFQNKVDKLTAKTESKEGIKQFEEIKDSFGPSGTVRRKMLKKWFRTIIENVIPDHHKFIMKLAPGLSEKSNEEYDTLFNQTKQNAFHKLKTEGFSKEDSIIYAAGFRGDLRNAFKLMIPLVKDVRSKLQFLIHQLIVIQNQIFAEQDKMIMFRKTVERYDAKFEWIPKLIAYFKTVESDPEFSIFEVWGIKKKTKEINQIHFLNENRNLDLFANNYDEVALSEYDF